MAKKRTTPEQPPVVAETRDLGVNGATHRFFERVERLVLVADDTQKCEIIAAGALWRTVIMLVKPDGAGNPDVCPLMLGRCTGIASALADLMATEMIAASVDIIDPDELLVARSRTILTCATGLAALAVQRYLGLDDAVKTPT